MKVKDMMDAQINRNQAIALVDLLAKNRWILPEWEQGVDCLIITTRKKFERLPIDYDDCSNIKEIDRWLKLHRVAKAPIRKRFYKEILGIS